ncbi:MAG: PadR family transcriptional regulator [Alicyclobacillus sp.]|nr:PadR family transcriptional regulator [Alicyclobacillus sp.]
MLEVAILGFLKEEPMHGYELKQRLASLTGHFRPVSDGALYPAIARLEAQKFVVKHEESGENGIIKRVLTLTPEGESRLLNLLREPTDLDISDRNKFFTILAFLRYLSPVEQCTVLQRRLDFLEKGKSFFSEKGRPVHFAQETDPFRKGMLLIAKETSRVEKQWLRETISKLKP